VPDRASGRRTTATVIGAIASKLLICGMLISESLLVWNCFRDFWISAALVFGAVWFLLDALVFWRKRPYTLAQMRLFLLGWNGIALISMPWVWKTAVFTR